METPSEAPEENILRIKSSSNAKSLASAISHALYESDDVVLRAIGAGAVNQACKAIAIASGYCSQRGMRIACIPGFQTVPVSDGEISAMVFRVIKY